MAKRKSKNNKKSKDKKINNVFQTPEVIIIEDKKRPQVKTIDEFKNEQNSFYINDANPPPVKNKIQAITNQIPSSKKYHPKRVKEANHKLVQRKSIKFY